MNYKELSDILIRESGRYDLQNADGSDNGLLRFVNSGQRMLDRKASILHFESRVYTSVVQGDYYITIPECRIIESVWLLDERFGDDAQILALTESTWDSIRIRYSGLVASMTQGTPMEYARGSFRSAPTNKNQLAQNVNSFAGFNDAFASPQYDMNGVFFAPAADAKYSFQVVGLFYTEAFAGIAEVETFWSALHPELLLAAARFWMEVANRNTEGRRDWETIIQDQLTDLDKDQIEQYLNAGSVMGDPYGVTHQTTLYD